MILQLKQLPPLLNRLYIPICKFGKPSIVKNKQAKPFKNYVKMEAIRQNIKLIEKGDILFHCDIITNRKIDIDAVLKLLFDSLEGVAYKNDKQIIELIVRLHRKKADDEIVIKIEEIKDDKQRAKKSD